MKKEAGPDAGGELMFAAQLAQKKLAVMKKVKSVLYDKVHSQGWRYASEQAVINGLRDAIIEVGLVFDFWMESVEVVENGTQTKNKRPETKAIICCYCQLTDSETGYSVGGRMYGASIDAGGKNIWQAIPGCVKYWLSRHFLLALGDDPEAVPDVDQYEDQYEDQRPATPRPRSRAPADMKTGEVHEVMSTSPQREAIEKARQELDITETDVMAGIRKYLGLVLDDVDYPAALESLTYAQARVLLGKLKSPKTKG